MVTTHDDLKPNVHVMNDTEVESALEELQQGMGYEELRSKAESDALTASERATFRKIERLLFLLNR